jgi:archaellum component FlaC
MQQLSNSIRESERTVESIGDTNTKLQENQQRTESTIADFKESVSISRESVNNLQNRISDIEGTTKSIGETLNRLDELQLRQQEAITRAESINNDIRKSIETNK